MFTLKKNFRFEASHQLKHYEGKCCRLHGHSWKMTIEIKGEIKSTLNNMVIDYNIISKIVNPLLEERLDHFHLNDTLNSEDPTSEYVAKWIFDYLYPMFASINLELNAVELNETCTTKCRYER